MRPKNGEDEGNDQALKFWMRAAALGFGAWAVLLAIIGWLVSGQVTSLLESNREARAFLIQLLERVTKTEAENERDKARLDKLENELNRRDRS